MLPLVQEGVSRDRKLQFLYRKDNDREERVVDPLGLVAKGSAWYLVAQTERGFRTYRVSRIEQVRILDEPSQRPPNFDLAEYWKTSTTQFRQRPRYDAVLRLEPRAADELKTWGCGSCLDATTDSEGWTTMKVQFDDEEHALFIVLGFGARVDVIEPSQLRERVAANIAALIQRRVE
jgi:predicted DNA-binding transcriptional regulator YafY